MEQRAVYETRPADSHDGAPKTQSTVLTLPPEVLSQCFQYLPFLDRFIAARVSHYWRSCALAYPALWADIRLSATIRDPAHMALVQLGLARSGTHPVDLECSTIFHLQDRIVQMLSRHMHRVRSITWYGSIDSAGFTAAAPMLERYVCKAWMPIPPGFLGGTPGVLRYVELARQAVPAECPPFATVTHLVGQVPSGQSARTLTRLFSVFPSLISLTLKGLPRDRDRVPGVGTAPPTLVHLSLETEHNDCNLGQYVVEWAPPETKDIQLSMPIHASAHLAFLLEDATEISIEPGRTKSQSEELDFVAITLPGQRLLRLHFAYPAYIHKSSDILVNGLLGTAQGLSHLRCLTLPLYTLHMLFRRRPTLPSLSNVGIIIQDTSQGHAAIDITRLYCLTLLHPYALSSITFDIRTCPPKTASAADAASLVSYITQYGPRDVRYVLRGLSDDVASTIATSATDGANIEIVQSPVLTASQTSVAPRHRTGTFAKSQLSPGPLAGSDIFPSFVRFQEQQAATEVSALKGRAETITLAAASSSDSVRN